MDSIHVDRHALRGGDPAIGWIIIYAAGKVEGFEPETHSEVNNKLFPTEEAAVRNARYIHSEYQPIVKALRSAE